ncbi:MAG: 3-(3-hydroxyphenyl)propionate hydroxylase, partial [Boseongicola sp. SB0667_bin_21]|nr:3-(3-hydroxyphenyl)propionate hydroxylase [Boseongicola sp. SB0667_bin_21]
MRHDRADVIIVGLGPTGATLANLLAECGVRVIVVDREAGIYDLPRAVHFDGETMRVFQCAGISESLSREVIVNPGMRFVDPHGEILLDWPRPKEIGPQ